MGNVGGCGSASVLEVVTANTPAGMTDPCPGSGCIPQMPRGSPSLQDPRIGPSLEIGSLQMSSGSSEVLGVAAHAGTRVLIEGRKLDQTPRQGDRHVDMDGGGRGMPLKAEERAMWLVESGQEQTLPLTSEGSSPAKALILDFWPPEPGDHTHLCGRPQLVGPRWTNTPATKM